MAEKVPEFIFASCSEKRRELCCHWLVPMLSWRQGSYVRSAGVAISLGRQCIGYVCCGMPPHHFTTWWASRSEVHGLPAFDFLPVTRTLIACHVYV
jgi:hypothetical protein